MPAIVPRTIPHYRALSYPNRKRDEDKKVDTVRRSAPLDGGAGTYSSSADAIYPSHPADGHTMGYGMVDRAVRNGGRGRTDTVAVPSTD